MDNDNLNITEKNTKIDEDFKIIKSIYDNIFGNITVLQNKINTNLLFFSKKIILNNKNNAVNIINELINRINLNYKYLLKLIDFKVEIANNNIYIDGFYLMITTNLLLKNKLQLEKTGIYSINEIKKILIHISKALNYLNYHQLSHCNIRPEYIGYYEEFDAYILIESFDNKYKNPYQNHLNYILDKQNIYVSPILFNLLLNKKTKINHDKFKSDIFSLGLILLESLLLKNINDIYNYNNKEINFTKLRRYLQDFKEIYEEECYLIYDILENMLERNEDKRSSASDILLLLQENPEINSNNNSKYNNSFTIKSPVINNNLNTQNITNKIISKKVTYILADGRKVSEQEYINLRNNNLL